MKNIKIYFFNDKENRFLLEFTLAKAGAGMTAATAG